MTSTTWDAERYDAAFGFVSDLGRGLLDLLAARPGERVLDLGCGTGHLAAEIADRGATVHGIDADAAMIAKARSHHRAVTFSQADGHDFAVDNPYDAVVSNAALHWMLRPRDVIARVHAALRSGGRFVGELGGQGNVATIVEAISEAAASAGVDPSALRSPWFFPSPAQYAALLEDGGFTVRLLQHFDRPTALDHSPDGMADWIRMFAPALLAAVPPHARERVIRGAAERVAPALHRDGHWYADYVRLRFVAER